MQGWLYVNGDGSCTFNGKTYPSEAAFRESQELERNTKQVEEQARKRAVELQIEHRANELAGIAAPAAVAIRPKPTRDQILRAVREAMA